MFIVECICEYLSIIKYFVIRNFRGHVHLSKCWSPVHAYLLKCYRDTFSSVRMLKGYMVRERLDGNPWTNLLCASTHVKNVWKWMKVSPTTIAFNINLGQHGGVFHDQAIVQLLGVLEVAMGPPMDLFISKHIAPYCLAWHGSNKAVSFHSINAVVLVA